MAVLVGMVPVTVDVTVRVVGQAVVFIFAPAVGVLGMAVKIIAVEILVVFAPSKLKIEVRGTFILNLFGGISSPAIVFDKLTSASKDALRKYYALNRITVSTIVLAELAITYALITAVPSDNRIGNFSRNMISEGTLRLPSEVREDLYCANICPAEQVFLAEKVEYFVKRMYS